MPTLQLPGELTSLDEIADFVLVHAAEAGLDMHATYQLRLAVDELATNIVAHGYAEHNVRGDIRVTADIGAHSLTVVLEDTAVPYNPLSRDLESVEDEFDEPLEDRAIGGLGIFFVRRAVHDFQYEYRDGRNRNILVVERPGNSAVGANSRQETI